ncbi:hypothetical protein BOTCAL_0193g00170 [Botryotinia calthae]|uniref:non-specific serine/threonine protein kinase n=1 Tax=Botryotinia calthae TaxID=38488 RepID=A0A4Y8D1Y9_9HELO|nr:hypothetical protein BOTCAL_0193g00170 [Botryotinia calthae]
MQAPDHANKFDYTDKVLEIIEGQNVADESVEKRLRELFIEVNKDVQIETENKVENHQRLMDEAAMQEEEADARAEAEAKAENAEKRERRMERDQRKLDHEMILAAVQILRTIHQTTMPLRHNKWRKPNAGLTNQNIRILGKIGEGSFGAVYLIENSETKDQYAMKTHHPSICNLEAFFDLRIPGQDESDNGHCHIFEYCDWGTLEHIVEQYNTPRWGTGEPEGSIWGHKPKNMPTIYKYAAIPEAFIWHVYMQTMEGLSFLHGDHELNKKQEFHQRNQVICLDIKLDNIFLQDSGKPNTYPTVKIGDFGEATYVPHGDSRWHDTGNALCKAPEEPYLSAKYDVWCVGAVLHVMSHSGRRPRRPGGYIKENIKDEPKWGICDPHLSKVLAKELEKPREMDVNKRLTAAQILKHIRPIAEETIRLTYRQVEVKPLKPTGTPGSGEKKTKEKLAKEKLAKEQLAKEQLAREQQAREKKTKEQLAKEQLAKEQLAREQQVREKKTKEQLAKEQLAKEQQVKEQLAKKQQAKEQLAKKQQAKEQQAKEQLRIQREEELKRQREEELKRQQEEGQIDESTSLAPPQKRRLIRYRKLRAYRE